MPAKTGFSAHVPAQSTGVAVLLSRHGDVHCHDGHRHTRCGRPVQADSAVAVTNSQIMVFGLTLCATCYHPSRR